MDRRMSKRIGSFAAMAASSSSDAGVSRARGESDGLSPALVPSPAAAAAVSSLSECNLAALQASYPQVDSTEMDSASHISDLGTLRVLLVEDDPVQSESILVLFEAANTMNEGSVVFDVTTVATARESLDAVRREPQGFEIILLDMILPDINGYDLLPAVRPCTDEPRAAGADARVSPD